MTSLLASALAGGAVFFALVAALPARTAGGPPVAPARPLFRRARWERRPRRRAR